MCTPYFSISVCAHVRVRAGCKLMSGQFRDKTEKGTVGAIDESGKPRHG